MNWHGLILGGLFGLALVGCGEEAPVTTQRGMGPGGTKIDPGAQKAPEPAGGTRRSAPTANQGAEAAPPAPTRPNIPTPVLAREDFSGGARDPFHTYLSPTLESDSAPVEVVDKQRNVKLAEYDFEQLKLIAIVNAGRNVAPRALFLAESDSKSKSVRQGEYFSRAEVLLASVNRDYIEIEIVDPELTPGWNMERGERRVIYLKEPGKD